ncbi:hypothetical protein HK27_02180 [Acetobacter orientalis]|uniref:hypothetical protein n=1 Tax=Acetobacter orientalis TaxID=146474 RepID=UPI000A37BAB5|nr:hypothetical protein [Acetobacter orientalis]OUJ17093.1 hypothetical protein HK27_02180 [Acetobacter orientalis]
MAVRVFTDAPEKLLSALKQAITDGVIQTWEIDSDGDLTHTSIQWGGKAWMRPHLLDDRVVFNIIASKKTSMSKTVYGVYHGRLIQTLLIHFDDKMKTVSATALGTVGDNI